jgi:hypothetical protein
LGKEEEAKGFKGDIRFNPLEGVSAKKWEAWDKYTLALTLLDMEMGTIGFGRISNIKMVIKNKNPAQLTKGSRVFIKIAFEDLKEQVSKWWVSVYEDDSQIKDLSAKNWIEAKPRVLHQYLIMAAAVFFRSPVYKTYMTGLYEEYINEFDRDQVDTEGLLDYFVIGMNIESMVVQADYVDELVKILLTQADSRPSLADSITNIKEKAATLLTEHKDNAAGINQISAFNDMASKSSIIVDLQVRDLNPKDVPASSISIGKKDYESLTDRRRNRIILV